MFAEFSSTHLPRKSRFFFFLIVLIFLESALSLQGVAYGHAVPDTYSLKPNSLIDTLLMFPDKISILFSERPDPKVSYIHVEDSKGQRIDSDDFKITGQNGREGSISLNKNMAEEGVYSISWLTLSLDDGHVAKGSYVVGVGNIENLENASQNLSQENNIFYSILGVLKSPVIIGQVSVLGFVVLHIFLCNSISKTGLRNKVELILTPRFTKLVVMFSIMMGIGVTLLPLFQSVVVSGSESSYINNLGLLLFGTDNGVVWIVRVICSVTIICIAYFYSKEISRNVEVKERDEDHSNGVALLFLILILACIFIGTNSFVSHSGSLQSWSLLGIITDFIHSVAVSIWIGGLLYVSYVFFPRATSINTIISEKTPQFSSDPKSVTLLILSKFSLIATVTIAIVGISGLSLGWLHIRTADELFISDYGRTLIVKLCIAASVVFMGVYHQFWTDRMVKSLGIKKTENKKIAETKFGFKKLESIKLTIKIETILMMLLLCAASLLTVTATPDLRGHENMRGTNSEHLSNNIQKEFAQTLEVQDVPIDLLIHPFHAGFNNFTMSIIGENQNLTEISNVFIEFKKSDLSLGPIIASLERTNATSYSTFGGYLSQSGEWDLKITIQRINSYDLTYRLGVTLNSSEIMTAHDSNENPMSGNLDPMDVPSEFTNIVILMSIVLASISGFFFVRGLKRLTIINRELNIE